MRHAILLSLLLLTSAPLNAAPFQDEYLDRFFGMYPSRATASGRHDFDDRLEDLSPARRKEWTAYNRAMAERLRKLLAAPDTPFEDRLDAELVLRQAEIEIHEEETLKRAGTDPLFWTGLLGEATVYLLVRDDIPKPRRLEAATARARLLPRLAAQAREALAAGDPAKISPELCALAAGQVRASAQFYADGFPKAGVGEPEAVRREMEKAGAAASAALGELAAFLDGLGKKAGGSPRLGADYAARFRLVTGIEEPVDQVLAQAEADLAAKRVEAAAYGRSVWKELMPGEEPPADDPAGNKELLRRLFARVSADRAKTTEEFVADYRDLTEKAVVYVRQRGLMTLPEPLTLHIDRSPSFFIGQSVGGVYPAGPYAPEAKTLYFLPTPPDAATPAQREAFFRDFNHHFNVMITPHEIVPGHYVQLKLAARHPRKVRAIFFDGVYVEGWGTFCERLLLDLGWGGPLDRLAHLKKQLENISRTVVDIRVHTRNMEKDEVLRYVRDEALQDEQFAGNMWVRAITSSPQLTFYHLGYRQVRGLYDDVRAAEGESFDLRSFMDGMMTLGPVPVRHYREARFSRLPAPGK